MGKFYHDAEINAQLQSIIQDAQQEIILISPYIKFHERIKSFLKNHEANYSMNLIVVFGKNEENISKSLNEDDFNFLKEFPNIEIRYEKRLHAKYYANERSALLTSMNLYDYSQNNNIEFGIVTQTNTLLNQLSGQTIDRDAFDYFKKVIEHSDLLYKNQPIIEKRNLGLTKEYKGFERKVDLLSKNYSISRANSKSIGYCIRTGEEIPYNIDKPFSRFAFREWNKFKNESYPENYCHYSGEESNGATSLEKPVLSKNWQGSKM